MIEAMSAFSCTLVFHIDWSGTSAAGSQSQTATERLTPECVCGGGVIDDKEKRSIGADALRAPTLPYKGRLLIALLLHFPN